MADVEIIRNAVVVVDSVGKNDYGDLIFTCREGGEYKISAKRVQYFEKTLIPDAEVQLNYAMSSFGKEYIYSAVQVRSGEGRKTVQDNIPPEHRTKPPESHPSSVKEPIKEPKQEMKVEFDRTRKSIERQKSLDLATQWAIGLLQSGKKDLKGTDILVVASVFEKYLETGKAPDSPLVKAAKEAGAVEAP